MREAREVSLQGCICGDRNRVHLGAADCLNFARDDRDHDESIQLPKMTFGTCQRNGLVKAITWVICTLWKPRANGVASAVFSYRSHPPQKSKAAYRARVNRSRTTFSQRIMIGECEDVEMARAKL